MAAAVPLVVPAAEVAVGTVGAVVQHAAGLAVATGVAKLTSDGIKKYRSNTDSDSKTVKASNGTEFKNANDAASVIRDPCDSTLNTPAIQSAIRNHLPSEVAEKLRLGTAGEAQSPHLSPCVPSPIAATKVHSTGPKVSWNGQWGVRVELPWPIALAAIGIYVVGSFIFSSSNSASGVENTTKDMSSNLTRKSESTTKSGSNEHSSTPNCEAGASGKNAASGGGGDGGNDSSDEGEEELDRKQQKEDHIDSLPTRDPRLNRKTMEDLLEESGKTMHKKLMKELEAKKEGHTICNSEDSKFRIDAGRFSKRNPNVKSWKLQLNRTKDKRLNGLKDGRGTHATLFEGKVDMNNKPSLNDWRREIMETYNNH